MSIPRSWYRILFTAAMLVASLSATAACADGSEGPVSTGRFNSVAIGGYDSVGYHDPRAIADHAAAKGSRDWVYEWRGASWRFGSEESYEKFRADPVRYQPAYGGHCANALSLGEGLVRTDGTHWEILDDQLYLFYAARGRDRWLDGNHATYRVQADKAWKEITGFDN